MHCLAANGGATQHESNQFILRTCQRKGLPVHAWDEFHQTIRGMRPLRTDFFQTRVVNNDRAHFRGFAADTLAAMDVKGLFILVMFDSGDFAAMEGELRCFWHMYTILQILRRGRFADLDRLKWEIA